MRIPKPAELRKEGELVARVAKIRDIEAALGKGELDPDDPDPWLKSNALEPISRWRTIVANTWQRQQAAPGREVVE